MMTKQTSLYTAKDIMTKHVICVYPQTTVLEAHGILAKERISGLPVVDKDKRLVGILTEYDLLARGSHVHIPTLQRIFDELPVYKKSSKDFKKEIYELSRLTVDKLMNHEPISFSPNAPAQDVVNTFSEHHSVNPVVVVDEDKKVVGVISRRDVMRLFYEIKLTN